MTTGRFSLLLLSLAVAATSPVTAASDFGPGAGSSLRGGEKGAQLSHILHDDFDKFGHEDDRKYVNGAKHNTGDASRLLHETQHRTLQDDCMPVNEISFENFEDDSIDGWTNGKLDFEPNFTKFLGRMTGSDETPSKVFPIGPGANQATIQFDFYEIDRYVGRVLTGRFAPQSVDLI